MQTTVLLDHQAVADGHLVRMLLRIEGSPPPAGTRTPLDLALVLDRSGSMHGEKLQAARRAAAEVVRRLWPEDRVSVVVYDDRIETLAECARGGEAPGLMVALERVEARGSTNLSGGWLRGRELVSPRDDERRLRRVLLLTDGLANEGITDPDRLVSLAAGARAHGISTTTLGFGRDYDERLLRAMAEAGGGATYYIEHADQASAIFQDELDDLLETCAQNVRVTLAPGAASHFIRVRHGYPSTGTAEGVRYDLGDLYAREPRLLLAEFALAASSGGTAPVATITVAADVLAGDDLHHETLTLPITLDAEQVPHVDATIQREALLLDAADARERAADARERGSFGEAQRALHTAAAALRSAGMDDEALRAEIEDLDTLAAAPIDHIAEATSGKYLHQMAYHRKTGRSLKRELIDRQRRRPE